ncbi:MAG: SUMF1/EgtB/PvdO family nonheme iron enzyme, partial [Planctomycetaceae bacterium]|nr:SUMF1/EgtB/PvdO family nonheme iron enzyme [Planctomycetaceae bacterium]
MSETNQIDNSAIVPDVTGSDAATSDGDATNANRIVESQTTDSGKISGVGDIPESWTLKEQLAKTSVSETWNVFDRARKKKLLLKRISLDTLGDGGFSRFNKAITVQENITSRLFLKPLQYGSGGGWCWFARETTGNNKSLNEWVVGGKLMRPFELSKRFAVIAAIIAEIHQLGLVHGAIKPTNVFLVGTDSALLCDIDAAGLFNPTIFSPEQIAAAGNNEFLAPEQRGSQFDARCDIWALAATAVYAATGLTPDKFDPQRLHQEIRDPLVRALAENPDDRFATIDDFRAALLDAVKVAKPTLFTDELSKPAASQAAPAVSSAQPRAAAPDSSVVQNNVNAVCPQCKTPVSGQLRACPKCNRPYEEPCLNCNALNPFWLPKCRACGADVAALKQKTVAGLIQQQQYVMGLRKACGHDKALPILKMMSLMVHPDFFNYREWAKSMIPIVQKERRDLRAYIEQVKTQAKATFDAQKYDRVQAIIEKIPAQLLDEEMRKMHADAGECITEVESLIREIRNAISTKQYSTLLSCVQRYLELKAQDPEARSLQEKIEKLTTVTTQGGMKFRRIPSGKFYMGSHESDEFIRNNERPQHRVSITRSFLLGVYPVMQSEFQAVCEYNPSLVTENPRCPVENVTWYGAIEFCNL